jgi:hypothetical protein
MTSLEARTLLALTLDGTFGTGGVVAPVPGATGEFVWDPLVAAASDGGVILAQSVSDRDNRVVLTRLSASGTIDPGFGKGGHVDVTDGLRFVRHVLVGADGNIRSTPVAGAVQDLFGSLPQGNQHKIEVNRLEYDLLAGTLTAEFTIRHRHAFA